MKRNRGKIKLRDSLVSVLMGLFSADRNNVTAIIVPTRMAFQPSNMNEGMKSLVSTPPRVFLQSDPEMWHFRVQEALNEANSHILLQRKKVAQERAMRVEAEKEVTRQHDHMRSLHAQIQDQTSRITSLMEDLVHRSDRTRLELETESDFVLAFDLCKKLAETASQKALQVIETTLPLMEDIKIAEQRVDDSSFSFGEFLDSSDIYEPKNEAPQETRLRSRYPPRQQNAMPSPDFLLFGDGELEESGSDKVIPVPVDEQASGDTDYGHGSGENESWLLGVHELFNHRNGQNPDLQETMNVKRRSLGDHAVTNGIDHNRFEHLETRSLSSELAARGEVAWMEALQNAALQS
uniref:Uncharacterized protein n=2 Tax=Rhodosorus marinus TaxID=101924 RepID=A0A7S2ZPC1_9RHOD|mmetsp:Transcript_27279/g.106556  ORF Transcript_27279/g.106556 Transcript_27279/m.106556 type:complete len:350 (+) Transcript_27279:103-1152(+)